MLTNEIDAHKRRRDSTRLVRAIQLKRQQRKEKKKKEKGKKYMRTNGGEARQDPHARFNLRDIRKKGGQARALLYICSAPAVVLCEYR